MEIDLSNITDVKVRIKDIQLELGTHKISKNQQYRMNVNGAEPTELNTRRVELTQELLTLEKQLHTFKISKKTSKFNAPDYQEAIYHVLKELLGKDESMKITREALRRASGNEPQKIVINYGFNQQDKEQIKVLSKTATYLKETLVLARKQIDRYIRQNEPEVNKADYHNQVRELITCMPSEKDIFKIKIN